jgi:DnaJ-class molecular chaperone
MSKARRTCPVCGMKTCPACGVVGCSIHDPTSPRWWGGDPFPDLTAAQKTCPRCAGTGNKADTFPAAACPYCGGTGRNPTAAGNPLEPPAPGAVG